MARASNLEARTQRAILEYLWLVAPQLMIFHVPNGDLLDGGSGNQDVARRRAGARRKWQGVLPGVPDLVLVEPLGRVAFIEVKSPRGVLTSNQKTFRDWCFDNAVLWMTARSIKDVRAALIKWQIPNKDAEAA